MVIHLVSGAFSAFCSWDLRRAVTSFPTESLHHVVLVARVSYAPFHCPAVIHTLHHLTIMHASRDKLLICWLNTACPSSTVPMSNYSRCLIGVYPLLVLSWWAVLTHLLSPFCQIVCQVFGLPHSIIQACIPYIYDMHVGYMFHWWCVLETGVTFRTV